MYSHNKKVMTVRSYHYTFLSITVKNSLETYMISLTMQKSDMQVVMTMLIPGVKFYATCRYLTTSYCYGLTLSHKVAISRCLCAYNC